MNSIKLLFFGLTEMFIKENSGTIDVDYLSEDR